MDVNSFKDFLETPELLLGIPLILLGLLGLSVALAPSGVIPRYAETVVGGPGGHPTPQQYITVGLILSAITILEVAVYYIGALEGALVGILMVLSAMKFVLVALYFMHLQFDNRLFSTLFTGGLLLVIGLFLVVLSTMGASLV
ncbi:MAG: cytochrome C oxidase subunit IV family protein [Dehalococcoidia bacterium]